MRKGEKFKERPICRTKIRKILARYHSKIETLAKGYYMDKSAKGGVTFISEGMRLQAQKMLEEKNEIL